MDRACSGASAGLSCGVKFSDFTSLMKTVLTIFLGLASLTYAQTTVTLDGASGSQTFNVARSTTGGLSLGLGFEVEYLIVGGGGGGGNGYEDGPGGGGGAGGLLQGNLTLETATSIGVAVGAGGLANSGNGGNSSFGSTIALGGGGGGGSRESGLNGGSGGGAGGRPVGGSRIGGTASIGQGNSGGGNSGNVSGEYGRGGGGGGGAGSAGASSSTRTGAAGGAGLSLDISGTNVSYAVGGSGGSGGTGAAVNASIIGGGGRGAFGGNVPGPAQSGGQGAAGIVIARYKGTSAGTGGSVTAGTGSAAGYTLHTFTTTGASALNFSSLNLSTRLGAVENGVISGAGDLTFTGPGTLTLNATNTYSGITRVNAGTLALGSSGSIGNSSGVSLANGSRFNVSTAPGGFILGGAQTLSGGGTITGDTTISGTHTPGFSPGIQTFENDLTYSAGSSIVWELIDDTLAGRGTSYDGINVGENLNFAGDTILSLEFALSGSGVNWSDGLWNSNITGNTGWKIFDFDGTISGFGNLKLANGSFMDGSSQTLVSARPNASFSLFQGTDGVYLNYSAVPEPSAALLGGLGVLALLRRRR